MTILGERALHEYRNEIIEECARVAESYGYISEKDLSKIIATTIRALKDKP